MRYNRTIEVSGVQVVIDFQTTDHRRHSQLKSKDCSDLVDGFRRLTEEWLRTIDQWEEDHRDA